MRDVVNSAAWAGRWAPKLRIPRAIAEAIAVYELYEHELGYPPAEFADEDDRNIVAVR